MKNYYVYELINLMGSVEYVGETLNPKNRLYQHTKCKPSPGNGKYYGRQDLIMNIVEEFANRKDALRLETELKSLYGLPTTEKDRHTRAVVVFTKDGNIVGKYHSGHECSRILGLTQQHVDRVAKGMRPSVKGYIIKYQESI